MPDFLRPIKYFSDGYTYFVSRGIGSRDTSPWFTVRVQAATQSMQSSTEEACQ